MVLIAGNLMIGGLLFFCALVIGAVFLDKWRDHKLSTRRSVLKFLK
jgi:hypothetical protein